LALVAAAALALRWPLRLLPRAAAVVVAVAGCAAYSKPMILQRQSLSAFMPGERLARKVRQARRVALAVSAEIRHSAPI
jgi:hypothetical protein